MTASNSKPNENSRELATQILVKVDTRKAYADVLLDHVLQTTTLTARDRALLAELAYGTLRWRRRLDAYLKPWMRRPLRHTDPFIRNLLRLALYQLVFLNRVPDYAVLNEAVELAKTHAGRKAAGFVNGVLRNHLRETKPIVKPDAHTSSAAAMADYWSHPEWLIKKWLGYFGATETEALLAADNEAAPLTLRVNLRLGTREALLKLFQSENIEALATPFSPQGIIVAARLPIAKLPGFCDGRFQVQGEASQLVAYLLDPKPGERILDACAAPGGKTTHLAEAMEDKGEIIAADISVKGLQQITENIERLKLASVCAIRADVSKPLKEPLRGPFDRVLVDAPCSGFGTLRSHPEIKWQRSESDVRRLCKLQQTILERVASYLQPGGSLVYSTCTLIEDENEKVVENFLERHHEFVLEDAASYLPEIARSLVRGSYFMALPHRHHSDGFFAARMKKVR